MLLIVIFFMRRKKDFELILILLCIIIMASVIRTLDIEVEYVFSSRDFCVILDIDGGKV